MTNSVKNNLPSVAEIGFTASRSCLTLVDRKIGVLKAEKISFHNQ